MWKTKSIALVACSLVACAAPGSGGDAPFDGGGPVDAHETPPVDDAGAPDSGTDALVVDAGTPDAGPLADPYEPAPPAPGLTESQRNALVADVRAALANHRGPKGARIENLATGALLFEESADTALIPASNTKLFTTAAAHAVLGLDDDLLTRVHGALPDAAGTVAGDVYVLGEHDFSASLLFYVATRDAVTRLAEALKGAGVRRITGRVHVRGEFVYGGSTTGYLDVTSHRRNYATALSTALGAAGITSAGVEPEPGFDVPEGLPRLLERSPIPLVTATSGINAPSHNEFADLLARRLGWSLANTSTEAAGAAEVAAWFRSLQPVSAGFGLGDGSGLSRSNRVSAKDVLHLLKHMEDAPGGASWRRSLAIAGIRGTITNRLTGADTRGRVFAKTGTLSDVIALSGFVEHRQDGQRVAFSVLLNDVSSATSGRAVVDAVASALAKPRRGSATRLPPPRLRSMRATGTRGFAELAWDPVDGAAGYLVWISPDCERFPRNSARFVRMTRFLAGDLPPLACARITALGSDGYESDPSATYATTPGDRTSDLLLVDGNDRWFAQPSPENWLVQHHDFLARLARALPGRSFDSVHHDEVASGNVVLGDSAGVLWASGEQSEVDGTLTHGEQALVRSYVASGGAILFSGAELLWDLDERGDATDRAFVADVLPATLAADDAETWEAQGQAGSGFADVPAFTFQSPEGMELQYADVLAPSAGAEVLVSYVGGTGGAAMAGRRDVGAVVVSGVALETVPAKNDLALVLAKALEFMRIE